MSERRQLSGRLTGGLLVVASAVLATSALPGAPAAVETAGFALVGTAVACFADLRLSSRRLGWLLVTFVLLAIGDRLGELAVANDRLWALPLALGGHLVCKSLTAGPRAVLNRAVPAIAAVALPLVLRATTTDALTMGASLVPVALAAALLAVPRARAERTRATLQQNQVDLDAVVMANLELRNVGEAQDASQRIARIATELLDAEGAVVWLQGPGRLLCAGGHGVTPPPEREVADGSSVERVLLTGGVAVDKDEIVLPLTASGGVFGAVTVSNPRRKSESFVSSVLQVFGAQAGYALERLRAVESLIDARFVDPVTGVGNRLAATASLATLHTGDAVLLLAIDELGRIRSEEGDARADLILGQLGLHLRTATRAGDLVARFGDDVFFVMLRDLNTSAESVVTRLLESWQATGTAGLLRAGAALHFADTTPLDTLDRATDALDVARAGRRDPIAVAAERAAWGPTS
jgi:GGDEF domain-containing protein